VEEILYLLGILMSPGNASIRLPLIFTGPGRARAYFQRMREFIDETLGAEAHAWYQVILDDPPQVARVVSAGLEKVEEYRAENNDAFFFNWLLEIHEELQLPFNATHENMAALQLHGDQPAHALAFNLRSAFSGIVAGNVRESGIRSVEEHGPFELAGDPSIIRALNHLLEGFVAERRMRLTDPAAYVPCYRMVV